MQQLDRRWELTLKTSVFLVDKQNCSRVTLSSECAAKRNEPAGALAKHSRKEKNKSHLEKYIYSLCSGSAMQCWVTQSICSSGERDGCVKYLHVLWGFKGSLFLSQTLALLLLLWWVIPVAFSLLGLLW